jgi:phospholipid/cholesterol/gamma-HCH transport system permease protein
MLPLSTKATTGVAPTGIEYQPGSSSVRLSGSWTIHRLAELESRLVTLVYPEEEELRLDASGIEALDTSGAWLLQRMLTTLRTQGITVHLEGLREEYRELLTLIQARVGEQTEDSPRKTGALERLGQGVWTHVEEGRSMLAFIGETFIALLRTLKAPSRIRWQAFFSNLERAGVQAIPIISLLSFLLGIVIAYQGGIQLRSYGANIFIVELVSLTMLRELAPMMTAIIIAGRTGSAYTAEIGTMRVTEEVDALRIIGISPMDLLVLPKLFGLMLTLPLLTLIADAMGVLGGMVMAASMLEVSFADFIDRIPQVVSLQSFLIGVGKAPVFAMIVAIVGCFQGFRVTGSTDSIGRQTTVSVVQSIFLVIVADAAFSILFSWRGI